jgi:hypothetical protein
MTSNTSKAAPFPFLLALVFFLLPFVDFSCQNQRIATINGYQAAVGGEIEGPQILSERPRVEVISGTPMLVGVAAAAAVAALLAFLRIYMLSAFVGVVGIVLLAITPQEINKQMQVRNQALITTTYQAGFYAILSSLILGTMVVGAAAFGKKES